MEDNKTMIMRANICFTIILFFLSLYFFSCGPQRRAQTNMSEEIINESPQASKGRLVFKTNCQKCHPDGESGVGPPLNNIHLPGFLVRAKIRSRALLLWTGRMPAFKKNEISKKEMDDLMVFIKGIQNKNR